MDENGPDQAAGAQRPTSSEAPDPTPGGPEPAASPRGAPGADRGREGSLGRAVANATDVGVAYGLAALRAGLRAGVGLGRAGAEAFGTVIDRSPIGAAAGAAADALEPAAARVRRQRAAGGTEARAAVEAVVGQVVDGVVQAIDIDGIVQDVDIDRIVQGIDIDRIVQSIDIDEIVDRIDINEIVDQLDIDSIVTNTEIGSLIVQSTGGVATEALDVVRSQGVSLDGVVTRLTDGILRRRAGERPAAPELLESTTGGERGEHDVDAAVGGGGEEASPGAPDLS